MYKRVTKTEARKVFNKGKSVWLLPSKVGFCINAPFLAPYEINKNTRNNSVETPDFDRLSNSFAYYNCNNELGNIVHYYVEK